LRDGNTIICVTFLAGNMLSGKNKEKKNFKGYSPRRQVNNLYGYCEVEGEY